MHNLRTSAVGNNPKFVVFCVRQLQMNLIEIPDIVCAEYCF